MTVEEKRIALTKHCTGKDCLECTLRPFCWDHNLIGYTHVQDELVDKAYSTLMKSKGDKIMEERTITITTHEYKGLVADQAILAKLEVYTETHEFLNDDFIRTLLGTKKPNPARIESEGD